jgi:hypothetical protein
VYAHEAAIRQILERERRAVGRRDADCRVTDALGCALDALQKIAALEDVTLEEAQSLARAGLVHVTRALH